MVRDVADEKGRFMEADVRTDAEVACGFMEPDAPKDGTNQAGGELKRFSPKGWWRYSMVSCLLKQPILDMCAEVEKLGRLYLVEAKLSNEQWDRYDNALGALWTVRLKNMPARRFLIHASAEEKLTALAAVLRDRGSE